MAEEILDEMEMLAATGPAGFRRSSGGFIHDFVREHDRNTWYVFLTIVPDGQRHILSVVSIGIYVRREAEG